MASSNSQTLVVVGSGPGIGVSVATLFAKNKFNNVALISRDSTRIQQDRKTILEFIPSSREVEVKTWNVDITNTKDFKHVLSEVEKFGDISCVHFNAAEVEPSDLVEFPEEEIVRDFMTTNIGLITTARWALPILSKASDTPSLLVTSSLLWADPFPMFFSLSMVKASQRNLVQSLQKTYPGVHIALINVGGQVSRDDPYLNPNAIARTFWELYSQKEEDWTLDLNIMGGQ